MKASHLFSMLAIAVLGCGCATTKSESDLRVFHFEFEGMAGIIHCSNRADGTGFNQIVLRDGERVVLRAWDTNQSGHIDSVLTPGANLEFAEKAYRAAIEEAARRNQLREQQPLRVFDLSRGGIEYRIESIIPHERVPYNRFITRILGESGESVGIDDGADGMLNRIEAGDRDLPSLQAAYEMVLEAAAARGMVERVEGRVLILPAAH
jgi:hypothetical protein